MSKFIIKILGISLFVVFTSIAIPKSEVFPYRITLNGLKYSIIPYISEENDSRICYNIKIENNSNDIVFIPKVNRVFKIGNRLFSSLDFYNTSNPSSTLDLLEMELESLKKGEKTEIIIVSEVKNLDGITSGILSIDFIFSSDIPKNKLKYLKTINSSEYQKYAQHITLSYLPSFRK